MIQPMITAYMIALYFGRHPWPHCGSVMGLPVNVVSQIVSPCNGNGNDDDNDDFPHLNEVNFLNPNTEIRFNVI